MHTEGVIILDTEQCTIVRIKTEGDQRLAGYVDLTYSQSGPYDELHFPKSSFENDWERVEVPQKYPDGSTVVFDGREWRVELICRDGDNLLPGQVDRGEDYNLYRLSRPNTHPILRWQYEIDAQKPFSVHYIHTGHFEATYTVIASSQEIADDYVRAHHEELEPDEIDYLR
jgi:hypothetical protein